MRSLYVRQPGEGPYDVAAACGRTASDVPALLSENALTIANGSSVLVLPDGWTPLPLTSAQTSHPAKLIAFPATSTQLQTQVCATAMHYAGSGANGAREAEYFEWVRREADPKGPTSDLYYRNASSCGLAACASYRRCGVDAHEFYDPYIRLIRGGTMAETLRNAVADVLAAGQRQGAWVWADGPDGPQPEPGDSAWICHRNVINSDHVFMVVTVRAPWTFSTVEGGQGSHGAHSGFFLRETFDARAGGSPAQLHGVKGAKGGRIFVGKSAGDRELMGWTKSSKFVLRAEGVPATPPPPPGNPGTPSPPPPPPPPSGDPHPQRPPPAGWTMMRDKDVTPPMSAFAVALLHDETVPFFGTRETTIDGKPILGRVEWHPPNGFRAYWHRGVTLYTRAAGGASTGGGALALVGAGLLLALAFGGKGGA